MCGYHGRSISHQTALIVMCSVLVKVSKPYWIRKNAQNQNKRYKLKVIKNNKKLIIFFNKQLKKNIKKKSNFHTIFVLIGNNKPWIVLLYICDANFIFVQSMFIHYFYLEKQQTIINQSFFLSFFFCFSFKYTKYVTANKKICAFKFCVTWT